MKKIITIEEQKQIMLEMLKFIDEVCRKNGIEYSPIGGTLIGAIRHHGYIPWDDDIDIILTRDNYEKLKRILDKETGRYQTLKRGKGGERFNFLKLIDTWTEAREGAQVGDNLYYGIYIDIFCYYSTAQNFKERQRHFKKIDLMVKLNARLKLDFKNKTLRQNVRQLVKNTASRLVGYKWINKRFDRVMNMYSDVMSDYVVSNWPIYGFEKEIQLRKNTEEYVDVKFENLTVRMFKNYDEILKTTFGDYMQLPPESERISKHNMAMWWREKKDEK